MPMILADLDRGLKAGVGARRVSLVSLMRAGKPEKQKPGAKAGLSSIVEPERAFTQRRLFRGTRSA
ncbi:hypothetical protein PSAC2689_50154 [Paraburkholderia sacchari]